MKLNTPSPIKNQKGFTLIEIIAVLVILGVLAIVAVPKYIDLQEEAKEKAAEGVWGAANSAASMNFASGLLGKTGYAAITDGSELLAAMDPAPTGWTSSGAAISYGSFTITITTAEDITADPPQRAILSKSW